jgi:hypothetical protein
MNNFDKYIEMTGQAPEEVLAGASTFGPRFIEQELIPEALEKRKKIVWIPDLRDGEDVGLVKWELQDL